MNPQGSQIVDTTYITANTAAVDAASSCSELQHLASEVLGSLGALQSAVNTQLAALAPMIALLTPPTSPTAVVTWVQNFITSYLTPQMKSATTYAAKAAALVAQVETLTAAIVAKAGSFTNCTVALPAKVPAPPTLPTLP